ncbi:MAG: hypothetical protein ACPGU9_09185 [Flavobacteriaceae bacterium]
MKSYFTLFLVSIFILSCTTQEIRETTLLDFTANNPSVIIHSPSIDELQNQIKENSFLTEFKHTNTYKSIANDFQFCNNLKSNNPVVISYAKVGKSQEFLLSVNVKDITNNIALKSQKTTYNNTEYQQLNNQNAYSIVLDSTLVVTSSEILMENLIRNRKANIRYSNNSLLKLYKTSDISKITAFVNLEKQPSYLRHLFPTTFLTNSDWISAELSNKDGISINGIATNTNTKHELASKLIGTSTEHSEAEILIPSNFTKLTSYSFDELNLSSEFENFNELVDGATEIVTFNDGKNQLCAFKLLNNSTIETLDEHSLYRNHQIYKNSYFKIPATICSPQPEFACFIEDFIVLSSNLESLQNCISHFQNKTTLEHQNYYTESTNALLSESHLINSQKTALLKRDVATVLNDKTINDVKLNNFPLAVHQVSYEDSYIQFNSIIKQITPQTNSKKVSQIASVTLDSDVSSEIQWVINHRTHQKELLVQDNTNQLYLISNKGKILWKKQLSSKIQGKVIQVDLFKNNKLQLAFTTEKEFMVLDRNGKIVDQFHKTFTSGGLLPLSVFDYDNNRNYRFVITQNNTIQMYDNNFKQVKGFTFNSAKSTIITSPKHIRLGTKDYIAIAESNGQLHLVNRQGKSRTKVNTTFKFNTSTSLYTKGNALLFSDDKNIVYQVNISTGKVTKSDILQGEINHFTIDDAIIVKLEDEKLTIKKNTIELDLGNYTTPEIFYLNKKYYISTTDLDTRKAYLFDSNVKLLDHFPVYGQSEITMTNMDSDSNIEFAVQGEANSILIYKM